MIFVINLLYLCPEQLEKSPCKLWNLQSQFANSSVCKEFFFFSFKPIGPFVILQMCEKVNHMCKSVEKGTNHASLCITKTCSCAYFEELSNDTGEWCNVLSQSCIHVVCNGVCSQPNSCDLSCLQPTLQTNPGCTAQRDVLDSSLRFWWRFRTCWDLGNPGSVFWNDPW